MDGDYPTLDDILARYNAAPRYMDIYKPASPTDLAFQKWNEMRTDARMKPWEPKYITDNIGPMLSDAASAVGVPDRIANRFGREASTAASWSPPGAVLDAAGDIGGAIHEKNYRDAILKAGMWNMMRLIGGPMYRGAAAVMPTAARQDAMQAAYRETMPGWPAITSPISRRAEGMQSPVNLGDLHRGYGHAYFNGVVPANVNGRSNMRPYLMPVE